MALDATGIDPERCNVDVRFNGQSLDINRGVDRADGVLGAGDREPSTGLRLARNLTR